MKRPTSDTYQELQAAVDIFNRELFGGILPDCLITLQRRPRTAGYFSAARFGTRTGQTTDEIALNPETFAVHPLLSILQTIAHEQVHQWQHHHGKATRRTYHDAQWSEKMIEIGLMPSSTGQPGGRKVGQKMSDYPVPGGKFLTLANRLLADKSFVITWYDRHPSHRPSAAEMCDPEGWDEDDPDDPDEHDDSVMVLVDPFGDNDDSKPLIVSTTSMATKRVRPDWAVPAALTGLKLAEPNPKPAAGDALTDRSNRKRYVCSKCEAKVWGKAGLRLACLDCGLQLA